MRTVKEVSKLTGVSIRTLHYYDTIGLLHPTMVTGASYRLYDDTALERLQQILLFRELEFPLKEIKEILNSPDFDKNKALEQQIELLTLRKKQIEALIDLAREIKTNGVRKMDFKAFDTEEMDNYRMQAKETWGQTEAYKEFATKSKGWTNSDRAGHIEGLMQVFVTFGALKDKETDAEEVQEQVKKLQNYISEHFYTCTNAILAGLGRMYVEDERMMKNIDKAGGVGTAAFVAEAIALFCRKNGE